MDKIINTKRLSQCESLLKKCLVVMEDVQIAQKIEFSNETEMEQGYNKGWNDALTFISRSL